MDTPTQIRIRSVRKPVEVICVDCREVLRELPGRRYVYEGEWDDRQVIIKVFTSRLRGGYHAKREAAGLCKLTERGIPSPKLLFCGRDEKNRPVLVTEKVPNAQDLLFFFTQHRDGPERKEVLSRWIQLLARMHEKGIVQKDLHAGNFLLADGSLFALDPAQMRFYSEPLNKNTSLKQLAMFICAIPYENRSEIEPFLRSYCTARNQSYKPENLELFEKYMKAAWARAVRRALKRTLRESGAYLAVREKDFRGIFRRAGWTLESAQDFARRIDTLMEDGQILKRGNTCFVSRVQIGWMDLVVKRYNHKGLRHSLRHTVKGSRARKCWLFGHRLLFADIPTARPVAFLEKRKGPLVLQSYVINEYIDGMNLDSYLRIKQVSREQKTAMAQQAGDLFCRLKQNSMTHGDPKLINVLIHKDHPLLIDLDSVKRHYFPLALDFYAKKMCRAFENRLVCSFPK